MDKDDKHAMETFVDDSLTVQVKQMLLADADDDEEIESVMDRVRAQQEALFEAGVLKRPKKKGKLKPRPQTWDSDMDGEWEDQPGAFELNGDEDGEDATPAPAGRRGRAATLVSDDDASVVSGTTKNTAAKAPAKKAPAKSRAPAKAKAPAKASARGRKKIVTELSDDEDNDSDILMMDEPPPQAKSQPKRAAVTKGRQTQLNFSQSQAKASTAKELSDDEISDDDAFEPLPGKKR